MDYVGIYGANSVVYKWGIGLGFVYLVRGIALARDYARPRGLAFEKGGKIRRKKKERKKGKRYV